MSIASELDALNGYILGAYDEINTKGGTVPANKNMANLASAIGSISTGSSTTITPLSVTENGTYTAPTGTAYSPVTVNVSSGGSGNWAEVFSGDSAAISDATITTIRDCAFLSDTTTAHQWLQRATLPNVTAIGDYAFYCQGKMTEITTGALTSVGEYAFNRCASLTSSLDLSNSTSIGRYAFSYTKIPTIIAKEATTVGDYVCSYNTVVTELVIPKSNSIPRCSGCTSLIKADFGALSAASIPSNLFTSCTSLATLIIRRVGRVITGQSGMFPSGCPIATGTGYIYVPSSLVSSYQAASYWSSYSSQIRAIEDYSSDGTVNGDINV